MGLVCTARNRAAEPMIVSFTISPVKTHFHELTNRHPRSAMRFVMRKKRMLPIRLNHVFRRSHSAVAGQSPRLKAGVLRSA